MSTTATSDTGPRERLRAALAAGDLADVEAALRPVEPRDLSARELSALDRRIRELGVPERGALRVAFLANFTVTDLRPHVRVRALRHGLSVEDYEAPFAQQVQAVTDPGSPLHDFGPDIVVLMLSPSTLRPRAFESLLRLAPDERRALARELVEEIAGLADEAARRLGATVLAANVVPPAWPEAGIADASLDFGEAELHEAVNAGLRDRLRDPPGVRVLDLAGVFRRTGTDEGFDPRRHYLARMPWAPAGLGAVADEVVRHLVAETGKARKCVVVDLDGTLWGGVLGEDGPDGIRIGPGDPVGEAHADLQARLRALKNRGLLLAIASKNDERDVRAVFERRAMPLSLDDFATTQIHWNPKVDSLRAIARTLNIGLDSLVFLDDNRAETEVVRQALPEVWTVALEGDPSGFPRALDGLPFLERAVLLPDDREKTDQYHAQRTREEHRTRIGDLAEYLASLETKVVLRDATPGDLPRLHQLFTKTNQFNLTTRRHGTAALEGFMHDTGTDLGVFEAEDRFGRLGTVGAWVGRRAGEAYELESFLMSCRAMGRGIETAVMNHVKRRFLAGDGLGVLRGAFVPTDRNTPARDFYAEQGFTLVEETDDERVYEVSRDEVAPVPCDWIEVAEDGAS